MKKLLFILAAIALMASCGNQHTREGYLPVTTTSDSAAFFYFNSLDTFHYKGVPGVWTMLDRAIEQDSNFFMSYVIKSMSYLQFNRLDDFKNAAQSAIDCSIDHNEAELIWKDIIKALMADKDADISSLTEQFVIDFHDVAESYLFAAIGYKDQPKKALDATRKAAEMQPDDPWSRCLYGYRLFENEKFEEAIEQFKVYRELLPDAPNVYDSYADLYLAMENYGAAYECAMKAHQLGWGKAKAEKAKKLMYENRFISLHVLNLVNESYEAEFLEIIEGLNATVKSLGHGNIQYKVSKMKEGDDSKFKYTIQSNWPNQKVYDKIHNTPEWTEFVNTKMGRWADIITDQNNAHYHRIN